MANGERERNDGAADAEKCDAESRQPAGLNKEAAKCNEKDHDASGNQTPRDQPNRIGQQLTQHAEQGPRGDGAAKDHECAREEDARQNQDDAENM